MNYLQSLRYIALASALILLGAFGFQYAGYAPCELCYVGRWAHYAGIIFGLGLSFVPHARRYGLLMLAIIFLGNMVFSFWHAGIEWQFWPGPTACTGGGGFSGGVPDFGSMNVVQCDEPALRILGLSLAGWNGVISLGLAGFAYNRFSHGSNSVSQ